MKFYYQFFLFSLLLNSFCFHIERKRISLPYGNEFQFLHSLDGAVSIQKRSGDRIVADGVAVDRGDDAEEADVAHYRDVERLHF